MPQPYDNASPSVMVASTWLDLKAHRRAVHDAILRAGMTPVETEELLKSSEGSIRASLRRVQTVDLLIVIVGHRYGFVSEDPELNPNHVSALEMEYIAAQKHGIPVLIFLMSEFHSVLASDIDVDIESRRKLLALRNLLSKEHLVREFSTVQELRQQALLSLVKFWNSSSLSETREIASSLPISVPLPPEVYAVPLELVTENFVGRKDDLALLDKWSMSTHPLGLITGLGGIGKTTLAWHWLTNLSDESGPGFAGKFWFNFDDDTSVLSFLKHALVYMRVTTSLDADEQSAGELMTLFRAELSKLSWLIVIDGAERIFPSSNSNNTGERQTTTRSMLYRLFTDFPTNSGSKILVISRFKPFELSTNSRTPTSNMLDIQLKGLDLASAEALLHLEGISGDAARSRTFISQELDAHPLALKIIAGTVRNYLPAPGDLDRWMNDPRGGADRELADLDIADKRTHLLEAALMDLSIPAQSVLRRISIFDQDPSFSDLRMMVEEEELERKTNVLSVIDELESRQFLTWIRSNNTYRLQPIVHDYMRQRMFATSDDRRQDVFLSPTVSQTEKLKLLRLQIRDVRCFEDLTIEFGEGRLWTMLLGDNGVGKTTVLRCIALALCDEVGVGAFIEDIGGEFVRRGANEALIRLELVDLNQPNVKLWTNTRILSSGGSVEIKQHQSKAFSRKRVFICGYGAGQRRVAAGDKVSADAVDSTATLFNDGATLQNPELVLRRAKQGSVDIHELLLRVDEILLLPSGSTTLTPKGLVVRGPWGKATPIKALGDGYRATLSWIIDLLGRALDFDPGMFGTKLDGIILLDEIEHHLHPRWQRILVTRLRRQFPGLQFIATTHSPFCAGGLGDLDSQEAQLQCLAFDSFGVVHAKAMAPLAGWRYDQIATSDAFDLSGARDVRTEKMLKRLYDAEENDDDAGIAKALEELSHRSIEAFHSEKDRALRREMIELSRSLEKTLRGDEK